MNGFDLFGQVLLPVGLGLFGFVEPCSLGATLVFLKAIEGRPAAAKIRDAAVFTVTRGLFIGLLGVAAVLIGTAFFGLQRAAWMLLGALYLGIGLLYVAGRAERLMVALGPRLSRLAGLRGSALLGLLFGLNVPACAAPLLLALLGAAAAAGATGATLLQGFVSLGLFGLALSLPLVAAVLFAPARRLLDRLAAWSRRAPRVAGIVFLALGLWSIWFGIAVTPEAGG